MNNVRKTRSYPSNRFRDLSARAFTRLASMLLVAPLLASAQVPGTIDYRGFLTDNSGQPLSGTVQVQFRIYDVETGGSALWEETHGAVSVAAGRFDVAIGSNTPLRDDLNIEGFDRTLFLGLSVNAGAELAPRLPLPGGVMSFAAAPTPSGETRVDCAAGESVAQAIARAPAGGRYVIEVAGDCRENLRIVRDRVTLRGVGGARLLGVAPSTSTFGYAIWAAGARSVVIDGITIEPDAGGTDPARGLLSTDNSSVSLVNATLLQGFDQSGIVLVENSTLEVFDSTITGNGEDGVAVLHGSFLEGRNATITNNGNDGIDIHNNGSAVLTGSTITGNTRYAAIVTLGSSLALDGNNLLESSLPNLDAGATIGLFDKGFLRVSGPNNTITNTVPVNYDSSDPYSNGGGAALQAQRNSSARLDRGTSTINGLVNVFNLSTIDMRDTVINGHLIIDALQSNMRLRNQGNSILNGNVWDPWQKFSVIRTPNSEAVLVNGFVDCRNNTSTGVNVDFQDPDDGYINCSARPTDLAVSIEGPPGAVQVGNPMTYSLRLQNLSLSPFAEAVNVTARMFVDGTNFQLQPLVPSTTCSGIGAGPFSGEQEIVCFFEGVGPQDIDIDVVDVTSADAGTVDVRATFTLFNPDTNASNDTASIRTTVTP